MSNAPQRLRRSHPEVKALLALTYPEYTGRSIVLAQQDRYHMADYWDGGSRTYVTAVDLATMRTHAPASFAHTPFAKGAHGSFDIPDGVAMVEHVIYCGRDLGIRVVVNANTFPLALPAGR